MIVWVVILIGCMVAFCISALILWKIRNKKKSVLHYIFLGILVFSMGYSLYGIYDTVTIIKKVYRLEQVMKQQKEFMHHLKQANHALANVDSHLYDACHFGKYNKAYINELKYARKQAQINFRKASVGAEKLFNKKTARDIQSFVNYEASLQFCHHHK